MTEKAYRIKVCGMRDAENITSLLELPVDYVGFIFHKKSPRYVSEAVNTPFLTKGVKKVGVFVDASLDEIEEQVKKHQLSVVQLHGNETPDSCMATGQLGVEVWKAFGVDEQFDFSALADYENTVSHFIFDTKSVLHGGSGETFDWSVLRQYKALTPYFVSGGLSVDNVVAAIASNDERLYGLDLNSRFEISPGLKNIELIRQALKKINDEQISG